MEHVAKLLEATKERPLAITLCKCSLCCVGYYCLRPYYIAGNRHEVKTD